ncbi:TolC family protein [bacterium]|nr:TolC family protein [bacterium]
MKRTLKWAMSAALLAGSVCGQEEPREITLSLDECVKIARDRSTRVLQGKLARDLRDADVDASRANFLPTVSTNWSSSNTVNGPRNASFIDEATGALVQSVGESTTSTGQSVGASISMSLFDAANLANLSAAKKNYHSTRFDLEASEDLVVFEAKRDYYSLLQAMSLLEVQREQVRVSEESLRRAETLNEIGSSPISEVFSAKADLERNRATLILRENDVEIARSNLSFTLGMAADVRIIPKEVEILIIQVPLTFEKAFDLASERPELTSDRYAMLGAKDNLRATRFRQRFPTFRLTGSYNWNLSGDEDFRGIEDLFLKNYRYTVSVSANLPIFNMGTTTTAKRQRIQYLQQMEIYEQSKRQLGLELRRTLLRLQQLRRSIEANEANVVAQEQDFRLQDEAYNFGAGTFLNRQQAQLQLFSARSDLVRARYDYQIQIATLEELLGMPLAEAISQ